jgi:DNA-binding MarR family transcriptional regulator
MARWLTDDEQRAWRGLLQMTSRLDARLNRDLQQTTGMSLADYDVLVRHIARMQRRGLVAREECITDKRGAFVVLADAGRDAIEKAAPGHVDTVRRLVFDGMSGEQVAMLESFVTRALSRLEPAQETMLTQAAASVADT